MAEQENGTLVVEQVDAAPEAQQKQDVVTEIMDHVVETITGKPPEPAPDSKEVIALKEAVAFLQDQYMAIQDKLACVLADPQIHATVVRSNNAFNSSKWKKGDYVLITDPELKTEGGKKLYGRSAKLIADGWDENGEVVVMMSNLDRYTLAVGIDGDEAQVKLCGKNDGRNVTLAVDGGQLFEVNGVSGHDFQPGDVVKVHMGSKQIIDHEGLPGPGQTAYIRSLIDCDYAEIECDGGHRVVLLGDRSMPVEIGDRVLLDRTGTIITRHLGKVEEGRFVIDDLLNVTWDDVGGCEEAKRTMIETVELPFRYPEIYAHYNQPLPNGVLLAGAPGTGKTLIAKATANSIAKTFGKDTFRKQFFSVKGPELLSMYVGHSEQLIRDLFHRARKATKHSGHPSFIFIDEAEAILPTRGSMKSSDVNKTIVPMFLAEMDGISESKVIVILATNRAELIDPAVVRHGRIDRHIKVPRPDEKAAAKIFGIHMRDVPLHEVDRATATAMVVAELFSKSRTLYNISPKNAVKAHLFCLRDAVNGGMIRGVIDLARQMALARDLNAGCRTGVMMEDFGRAVEQTYKQQQMLEHQYDIEDFLNRNNLPRCECSVDKCRSDD